MFDIKERLIYIKSMNSAAHTHTGAENMKIEINGTTYETKKRETRNNLPGWTHSLLIQRPNGKTQYYVNENTQNCPVTGKTITTYGKVISLG